MRFPSEKKRTTNPDSNPDSKKQTDRLTQTQTQTQTQIQTQIQTDSNPDSNSLLLLESPVECVFVFGLEFWFWAESRIVFCVCFYFEYLLCFELFISNLFCVCVCVRFR